MWQKTECRGLFHSSRVFALKVCLLCVCHERDYKLIQWICKKGNNSLTAEFPFLWPNSWCLFEPNSGCLLSKIVLKCLKWIKTWPHLNCIQRSRHTIVVTKGFRREWVSSRWAGDKHLKDWWNTAGQEIYKRIVCQHDAGLMGMMGRVSLKWLWWKKL